MCQITKSPDTGRQTRTDVSHLRDKASHPRPSRAAAPVRSEELARLCARPASGAPSSFHTALRPPPSTQEQCQGQSGGAVSGAKRGSSIRGCVSRRLFLALQEGSFFARQFLTTDTQPADCTHSSAAGRLQRLLARLSSHTMSCATATCSEPRFCCFYVLSFLRSVRTREFVTAPFSGGDLFFSTARLACPWGTLQAL